MSTVVSYTTVSLMLMTRPDVGSTGVTSAQMAVFAGQAEAEMIGRLSARYALPPSVPCPLLETLATDAAVYRLLTRRLYVTRNAKETSGIDVLYREFIQTCSLLAAGMLPLVDASGAVVSPRADWMPVLSSTDGYQPTFHEGPTGSHVQDVDKLDDLLAARDLDGWRDRLT